MGRVVYLINFLSVLFILSSIGISAQTRDVYVKGYLNKNGIYVQPHFRTNPNSSMFDNYSTVGNFNPYTGKPGWVEPYVKVSNTYAQYIPVNSKIYYDDLIVYLNNKDADNYFKLITRLDEDFRLFFTAIYKLNTGETKKANEIFETLVNGRSESSFIRSESKYWLQVSSKLIDAEFEFGTINGAYEKYLKNGVYGDLIDVLGKIRNPLNFYFKYLIEFTVNVENKYFQKAKMSLDSIVLYCNVDEHKSIFTDGYEALAEDLLRRQNTTDAIANGTYFYSYIHLIKNIKYFISTGKADVDELRKAFFEEKRDEDSDNELEFVRFLRDDSKSVVEGIKAEKIILDRNTIIKSEDTLGSIVSLSIIYFDKRTFEFYKNEFSTFTNTKPTKSKFGDGSNTNDIIGSEYLISNNIIGGLTMVSNNIVNNTFTSIYRTYFIVYFDKNGNVRDVSRLFR